MKIEQTLNLVKYQRELQVLLLEIKERSVRTNELMKRCKSCAINVSRLKPLVKKELLELMKKKENQIKRIIP